MTFLPRPGRRFAIASHALLVCALWGGTTAAQPPFISSTNESDGQISRQARRGAPTPANRHVQSSSRARHDYEQPAATLGPEEIAAEEFRPDFTYDSDFYDTEEESYGPWGEGIETCDECGQFDPSHKPGCGNDCDWRWTDNLSVFGGAHGFKGPVDEGLNGNFGLGTGLNWGAPLWQAMGIGYQVGWQAVISNFEGDRVLGGLWSDDRTQHFITAGIFHRSVNTPIQWGVVFDWLRDEYYIEQSLSQIRTEISLLGPYQNEIGFWGAVGVDDDTTTLNTPILVLPSLVVTIEETYTWEPTDQFTFFFRRRFASGVEGRIWGGFTGRSDGLFGADMRVPVSRDLAIQGGFNYLAPHEQSAAGGQREESWGLVMNLVWYPGRTATKTTRSRWRPLFNVADNSVFMVDRTDANRTMVVFQPMPSGAGVKAQSASAPVSYGRLGQGLRSGPFAVYAGYLDGFVDQNPVNNVDNDGDGIFGRFWDGNFDGVIDPINAVDNLNPLDYVLDDLVILSSEYDNLEDIFWDDNPEDGLYHESWRARFGL